MRSFRKTILKMKRQLVNGKVDFFIIDLVYLVGFVCIVELFNQSHLMLQPARATIIFERISLIYFLRNPFFWKTLMYYLCIT